MISAPWPAAAAASAPLTAPMPPIGTSQSPVPPPSRWYRKQTFCSSDGSSARANVPISASVAITPRTRSLRDGFGDRVPDRPADHRLPRLLCARIAAGEDVFERVVSGLQRCGHRRPQPRGDDPGAPVELGERLGIACRADGGERRFRPDQQAGLSAGRRIGRVRRIAAPRQPHPHTEIVDDAPRQQAHQIRVAGQPSVDAVEGVRRHRRAADVVESLEYPHPAPGTGQVGGGNQRIVPAADDDDVGPRIGDQPR